MTKPRQRKQRTTIGSFDAFTAAYLRHCGKGKRGEAEVYRHIFADDADEQAVYRTYQETVFDVLQTTENSNSRFFPWFHRPGQRCFLWWKFDSPEPRAPQLPEWWQLLQMGVLPADEIEELRRQAFDANEDLHRHPWHQGLPFRRDDLWWAFVASEERDDSKTEAQQLIDLDALTSAERAILADPARAVRGGFGPSFRTRFYYLAEHERKTLGLSARHKPLPNM